MWKLYACGTSDTSSQTAHCRERAARIKAETELAATKRKLDAAKANASMWHQRYEVQKQAHELSELAAKKAEARVAELDGLELCDYEIQDEGVKLSVFIPNSKLPIQGDSATLGQAMPAKESV